MLNSTCSSSPGRASTVTPGRRGSRAPRPGRRGCGATAWPRLDRLVDGERRRRLAADARVIAELLGNRGYARDVGRDRREALLQGFGVMPRFDCRICSIEDTAASGFDTSWHTDASMKPSEASR